MVYFLSKQTIKFAFLFGLLFIIIFFVLCENSILPRVAHQPMENIFKMYNLMGNTQTQHKERYFIEQERLQPPIRVLSFFIICFSFLFFLLFFVSVFVSIPALKSAVIDFIHQKTIVSNGNPQKNAYVPGPRSHVP